MIGDMRFSDEILIQDINMDLGLAHQYAMGLGTGYIPAN
jgi:hypothetical protein